MDNHVHLILVPQAQEGLRAVLGEAHRRYTRRINFREGWRGHLFQARSSFTYVGGLLTVQRTTNRTDGGSAVTAETVNSYEWWDDAQWQDFRGRQKFPAVSAPKPASSLPRWHRRR